MQSKPSPAADLFLRPTNVGDAGEPSFIGRSASFQCGATLRISLQIDEAQRITQAKFRAAGCSTLVAAASLLTEQVLGKTTGEAAALERDTDELRDGLGMLPPDRGECVLLACEALISAIRSYSDSARDEWEGDEALVCTCFCVSERTIERAVQEKGLQTIAEVTRACSAGGGCRSCYPLIEDILEEVNGKW
jgi:NifU-like protein